MTEIHRARVTRREREILALIATGLSNVAIASVLSISLQTVRTHRKNAMRKLGLHNAAAITAHVILSGNNVRL